MDLQQRMAIAAKAMAIGASMQEATYRRRTSTTEQRVNHVSYARFLTVQNQHMKSLLQLADTAAYESGKVLLRVIYEGSVRFSWLVRNEDQRASRVHHWLACWPVEWYRLGNEAALETDEIERRRAEAHRIADWVTSDDWEILRNWWESGKHPCQTEKDRLLALVDAYARTSFGEMKTQFFETLPTPSAALNRSFKVEYSMQSMIAHWTSFALWRNVRYGADESVLMSPAPSDEEFADHILSLAVFLYSMFLRDMNSVLGLDMAVNLDALDYEIVKLSSAS